MTLSLEMYAVRDIAPGEELTDSCECTLTTFQDPNISRYLQLHLIDRPLDLVWEDRQHSLYHHYGFKCRCSQCSLPPWGVRISDDRVAQIQRLSTMMTDLTFEPPPSMAMADHLIELYKMVNF